MDQRVGPRGRATAVATAFGSTVVTVALLGGLPYLLWGAAGFPWPRHVSSLDELEDRLAEPLTDPLLVQLLALVGWACWAAFACSVIREVVWYASHLPQLRQDRNVHREHVAALSVRGSLAALCIGTLVVALLGLWRPQAAGAYPSLVGEVRPPVAAAAPLAALIPKQSSSAANVTGPAQGRVESAGRESASSGQAERAERVERAEHIVAEGDTLWDIAQVHLGDPLKWPQIYALNRDRVQEDGARLRDPDVIRPGWRLTIPAMAPAAERPTTSPVSANPAPETTSAPSAGNVPAHHLQTQSVPVARPATGGHIAARPGERDHAATRMTRTQLGPAAIGVGEASLIGITAAAGLLAARRYWVMHRNRQRQPDLTSQPPPLSTVVDKAMQAAREAALPPDPDALVTRRIPPQRPRSVDTVTVGVRDDIEVALDELATPGGVAWTGPGAEGAARALLVGILTAAERRRPEPPRVTAVVPEALADRLLPGLPAQFTALTQTCDTSQAVQAAEQHLIAHARTQDEREPQPTATTHGTEDPVHGPGPGHLLLLTMPDTAHTGRLQALARRCQPGTLTVLTLAGPLPSAASWHVAADGTASPAAQEQHTGRLRLFHLTSEAGRDMTEMLLAAHGRRPRPRVIHPPAREPNPKHPQAATELEPESEPQRELEREPESGRGSESEPGAPPAHSQAVDPARPAQTKPVRLHVLGPITLYARGHPNPVGANLRGEVHEFLALLAAHPTGLLASDIADKLRLDTEKDPNALKNLRRAVRRALRTATGITAQEFVLLHGELHKLHPELVETDLADFASGLKRVFSAPRTEATAGGGLSAVREALAHYCGPFAQGRDYIWADAIREHLATQATDAALCLARDAERDDAPGHDRDAVLALLEHLGAVHPDHERLAQHTIRLYQAAGRHDAARRAFARLKRHLAELGVEPEPGTQALVTPRTPARQTR